MDSKPYVLPVFLKEDNQRINVFDGFNMQNFIREYMNTQKNMNPFKIWCH